MKVFLLDGGWTKRLRSLKDGEIRRATVQVLRDEGVRGLEQMSLAVGKGGKYTAARTIARLEGAPPSKGLMVRSGRLRRSLGQKVEAKGRRVEPKLVLALRAVPESRLRDLMTTLVSELADFVADPACAELQADGAPCASAEGACAECRRVSAILEGLRSRLHAD